MHVPTSDGHASSFANYEEKITSRNQICIVDPRKRAANLLSHMTDVERKVCTSVGKDSISNVDGVAQILRILRERFAPEAIDSVFKDVVKLLYLRRTDQRMDTYLPEFDMLQRKAEARMLMGSGFPDESVSAPCMQNAALPKTRRDWCWPASTTPWLLRKFRPRCVVYLDHVAVHPVKAPL